MFGIGPMELVIILAIALIFLGPGKLPEVGRAIGKTVREFRQATSPDEGGEPPSRPAETDKDKDAAH